MRAPTNAKNNHVAPAITADTNANDISAENVQPAGLFLANLKAFTNDEISS